MKEIPENRPSVRPTDALRNQSAAMAAELTRQVVDNVEEGLAATMLAFDGDRRIDMLDVLCSLGNGIYSRARSLNIYNPELVMTALEGVSALLQPEPNEEGRLAAHQLIEALQARYGRRT